jgi:hypothetical protein
MFLHEAVPVVGAVQRLPEPPEILRRILRLLRELDHVGVVHLGWLESLGLHDVLADEEHRCHGVAGHRQVPALELHQAIGERKEPTARRGDVAGELADVAQGRPVPHGPVDVHLGEVRRIAGLDRRDKLLLPVAERGPVELHLDAPLLRPELDVSGEDVVRGGDEAFEEPDAELRLGLGAGHRAEDFQPRCGTAGHDGSASEELPAGDPAGVELLGVAAETWVDHGSLLVSSVTGGESIRRV